MRLTDTRYDHERLSIEVAMRMIRFEARTYTIRMCTGLSDDRVRKLYKSYIARERASTHIRRRRGKSPREIQCVLQNAQTHLQASLLAGTFASLGLLTSTHSPEQNANVLLAARLCDAYEVYSQLLAKQPLSFEHAWFLWHALNSGSELRLHTCELCNGLTVQDRFSLRKRACPWCGFKARSVVDSVRKPRRTQARRRGCGALERSATTIE